MVPTALRFALALLLLVAIVAPRAHAQQPKVGDLAPAFLGKTLDDTPVMVGDSRGKVMVVTFWASWCAPCRAEVPILEAIQKVAGPAQIRVVTVNIEGIWEFRHLARRLSQLQLTLTSDADGAVSAAYGRKSVPHLVLIGRDGRILKVHHGYDEKHLDQIIADVNAALATR
jgi:thiol-disulfide isomerase/thioredoxin